MGNQNAADQPDDLDGFTVVHIRKRRGRPTLPPDQRLQPFSVRLSIGDVDALHARWRHDIGRHAGVRVQFSAWLREQLLRGE